MSSAHRPSTRHVRSPTENSFVGSRKERAMGCAPTSARRRAPPQRRRPRRRARDEPGPAFYCAAQLALPSASGRNWLAGTTRTRASIWLCPKPQNSWQGISKSPVVRNTVCTWLTKPGTTIVLTFVPETKMPWITSGLAKRKVTSRSAGTTTHGGTKANCVATMRVVTWPFCSTRVPRLGSVNSPVKCRVLGSIRSRFEGGLRCRASAANTVSPNMIRTNRLTQTAQRVSERWTSCSLAAIGSPHHAAREIDQQVDQQPSDQQQHNRNSAERDRTPRHLAQRQQQLLIEIRPRLSFVRVAHPPAPSPSLATGPILLVIRDGFQPARPSFLGLPSRATLSEVSEHSRGPTDGDQRRGLSQGARAADDRSGRDR